MGTPQTKTLDGFERQFGVNHLAHYVLTALLLPALVSSSTAAFHSRVVSVSSSSHRYSSIHWEDVNLSTEYDPFIAYGQSKAANVWMANYIDRAYGSKGVHGLSLGPGGIWTGLQQDISPELVEKWRNETETMRRMQTPEQGAATSVWAAVGKVWEGKGGKYLNNCAVAEPAETLDDTMGLGYASHAYDEEGEDRLWKLSAELTGIQPGV
jgi:NAD(P)-dependent dehydrogenase (short-subunit alcohol dehydrogenase family)